MGCGPSSLPAWEEEARAALVPLTLKTRWVGERGGKAAQLELTVTNDETNATLLKLYGGFVINKDQHVLPTETIIVAATGERYRGICKFKSHDTWNWSLQTSRAAAGEGASDLECAVCMSALHEPVKWPAHEDVGGCGHIFCRGCVVRCLSAEETSGCPLCRAPIAEGMTALKARRLPIDTNAAAEMEADAITAFECKPMSINSISDPPSYWVAPSTSSDNTTVPTVIAIRPPSGGIVRAWRDAPPKPNATEAEQRTLLGAVYTKPTSVEQPGKHTAVRQMELGVEADFLASVSKADLAVFLAVLTEMYWARGRANLCLLHLGDTLSGKTTSYWGAEAPPLPMDTIHGRPGVVPTGVPWHGESRYIGAPVRSRYIGGLPLNTPAV